MAAGSSTVTVYSRNHGMHTTRNKVTISGIQSESANSTLSTAMTSNQVTAVGGTNFTLDDVSQLDTIIGGVAISASNPGYIKIENEIIKYSAVNTPIGKLIIKAPNTIIMVPTNACSNPPLAIGSLTEASAISLNKSVLCNPL